MSFMSDAGETAGTRSRIPTMLLVIDIGNTNVVWGIFEGATLVAHWRLATDPKTT